MIVRDVRGLARQRIVRTFDFDERKLGNVEPIPMYWHRHLAEGFPHFLAGRFDTDVGHVAPPSFYLGLDGGSLAYTYHAENIPVHVLSDYLISAWARPDRLVHARAAVSAFYTDNRGRKLPGTERFGRLVGGQSNPEGWQQIAIELPGGHAKARQIGITLWAAQPTRPTDSGPDRHVIHREDLSAGVWFDDIQVIRLPRASLTTNQAGNVFAANQLVVLRAEVSDPEASDLTTLLEVRSADGRELLTQPVKVVLCDDPSKNEIELGELAPGLYHARLSVRSGKLKLCDRQTRFVKLGPRLNVPSWRNERFGVVFGENDSAIGDAAARLVELLNIDRVKVSVDVTGIQRHEDDPAVAARQQLLERFWQGRIHVTGILSGGSDASRAQADRTHAPEPLPLVASNPEPNASHPDLARSVYYHAGSVHVWQVGADEDEVLAWNTRASDALPMFRTQLKRLQPSAEMAVTWPILHQVPTGRLDADCISLFVPNSVTLQEIASCVSELRKTRSQSIWAVLEPLEPQRYDRIDRLADLVKRLTVAHAAGVDAVFMLAPWDASRQSGKLQLEPREDYLVFRTVAELLSASRPNGKLYLADGAEAYVFDREGSAILATWDDTAPVEGRSHVMYLGAHPEQIDMWGRVSPLSPVADRHGLRLAPRPVFLRGVETWHFKLRSSFALDPPTIESTRRLHERVVRFANPHSTFISGTLRLSPPQGWDVRPPRIAFSLGPGQELQTKVRLQFPSNETAGCKTLTGQFVIDSDKTYHLTARARFELGLKDFVVRSIARVEGDVVVVEQRITNQSNGRVDLEGYVMAPGQPRRVRMYRQVLPGQTVVEHYVLGDAVRLQGRSVRVGLKEIHGPRLLNQIALVQ